MRDARLDRSRLPRHRARRARSPLAERSALTDVTMRSLGRAHPVLDGDARAAADRRHPRLYFLPRRSERARPRVSPLTSSPRAFPRHRAQAPSPPGGSHHPKGEEALDGCLELLAAVRRRCSPSKAPPRQSPQRGLAKAEADRRGRSPPPEASSPGATPAPPSRRPTLSSPRRTPRPAPAEAAVQARKDYARDAAEARRGRRRVRHHRHPGTRGRRARSGREADRGDRAVRVRARGVHQQHRSHRDPEG